MKKRGFVLMETIVVIVVLSVALLTLFSSYTKILTKAKTTNRFDTAEYVYMTNHVKKSLISKSCFSDDDIFYMDSFDSLDNLMVKCNIDKNNIFDIKGIYVLKNINSTTESNLEKFDAYMIDYIRKLDVDDNDILLVVEYNREAINSNGDLIKNTNGEQLYETYIASLEW